MKTLYAILSLFIAALLLASCTFRPFDNDRNTITPSDTIITEERTVSGFTGIDFRTFGQVILKQGDTESLTIKGSDNVVPVIQTTVRDGVLVIQTEENINITGMNNKNVLTFTVVFKDLASLTISGAANVEMDSLSTTKLDMTMSGAGSIEFGNLVAQSTNITVSGLGNVNVAGEVANARISISGAGPVNAPDLKIQTADVSISGLGSATLWVTDQLTGEISGGGNVSYYGEPQTNTKTTGIGNFKSLGSK